MISSTIVIRRTAEADWAEVRALRLEMLADTPLAFGETLETALTVPEAHWRERARRGESSRGTSLAAIDGSAGWAAPAGGAGPAGGRWVGTMGGYIDSTHGAMLVGVFVTPEYRGASLGVTDALLSGVEEWAGTVSKVLSLRVHSENPRAIRAYERRGYVATGQLFPYLLNPHQHELEMRKAL